MAAGYKDFTAGAILTAADLEDYCENQSVMRFATAAARDTALSVVKTKGMVTCQLDTTSFTYYTGSAWVNLGDHPDLIARYVAVPTAWTAVTFTNSWVNYGAPYNNCEYRKVGDVVQMRGLMKSGTITAVAFTLPSGFRPPVDLFFVCVSNSAVGGFAVASTGTVTASFGNNAHMSVIGQFSITV